MAGARIGIYARQSVPEEQGIAQQLAEVLGGIDGRKLSAAIVDEYPDNATSGSRERGPGSHWARMLRDIDSGRINTVAVVAPDRLTRSLADVLELRPPRRDVRVICIRGGIDTDDAMGQFFLAQMVLMAEQEVRTKEARAVPYRAARRVAGHPKAGRIPHGYEWMPKLLRDERGTRYRIQPEEAEVVRFMFREALADIPLGSICRELNERGSRTRNDAPWRSSSVRRILLSPYYAALLPESQPSGTYRAEAVDLDKAKPGAWEPLVTVEQLRAVRAKLTNPARRKNPEGTARRWLLSGLAVCDVCGVPVRSARTREGFHGYRCVGGHFLRRGELLDSYVEAVLIDRLSEPDAAALIAPRLEVDLGALRARDAMLAGQSGELLRWFREERFPVAEIESMQAEVDAERAEIGATINAALAADPVAELLSSDGVRERWAGLSLARRRAVVNALLHVSIPPIGKGRRATTLEEAGATMALTWRREDRERAGIGYPLPSIHSGAPLAPSALPASAREAVSVHIQ